MTKKRVKTADGYREAVYSPCETYRYSLTAEWDANASRLLFVMLNPSKATELANDPTIERCERRARALGYGAFRAVNLFALRETSPQKLKAAKNPEGPRNRAAILNSAKWADDILAAWGVHGEFCAKGPETETILRKKGHVLHCLGCTKDGHPRHPLYVSYKVKPKEWI